MTEDIVDRLRWSGQDAITRHVSLGMHKLHAEAADEIDRLRERVRFLELWLLSQGYNYNHINGVSLVPNESESSNHGG